MIREFEFLLTLVNENMSKQFLVVCAPLMQIKAAAFDRAFVVD
jgi:hypothetical protein